MSEATSKTPATHSLARVLAEARAALEPFAESYTKVSDWNKNAVVGGTRVRQLAKAAYALAVIDAYAPESLPKAVQAVEETLRGSAAREDVLLGPEAIALADRLAAAVSSTPDIDTPVVDSCPEVAELREAIQMIVRKEVASALAKLIRPEPEPLTVSGSILGEIK